MGKSCRGEIFKSVSLEDYAHRYFLTLIFRKSDCSICLNYVIPLLQKVKNIKAVGIYADDDTISLRKMLRVYNINFPVFQNAGIVKALSLKRTPFVLLISKNGTIIYAHYPNYLKPERWEKFLFKVESLR